MLIIWLFSLLFGISAYLFSLVALGNGPWWSLLWGLAAMVILRGLFSYFRRWLILRESIADDNDPDTRTLEVNRYIFWKRATAMAVVAILYFGGADLLFNLAPGEAVLLLPGLLFSAITNVGYLLILFVAQFSLFFGPFILFGRMGRETMVPGDANYGVSLEDVRGQKSAVEEMSRILKLIEQGRSYVKAGGKRERGVLMVGPPGTGKTMLAKAIATSLQMPIIITSGASFAGMFMGMDMVNVWTMVRAAKKQAKRWGGCTIFIDEFDAIGQRRSGMGGAGGIMGGMMGGGQMGLNMLLVQMDGVDNPGFVKKGLRRLVNVTLDGLFVPRQIRVNGSGMSLRVRPLRPPRYNLLFIGATNRPSVLDEAITRPGRFGRQITFRNPSREARKDIADLYFSKKTHEPDLDTPTRREEFARVTEGYSPAMIEQALSMALMYAFEAGRQAFTWKDLREALGNIESGLVEPYDVSERDKLAVARHEVGHAVAGRFYEPGHAPIRLSVLIRSDGSLGRLIHAPIEEERLRFRSQMAGTLRTLLGAIASERIFYGENSEGVYGDLRQATQLAAHMVGLVAMGPDDLPRELSQKAVNIGSYLISAAEISGSMLEGSGPTGPVLGNPTSRRLAAQVMGAAYIDAWRLMHVNREAIDQAAEALMLQGELMGDEITGLLDSVGLRMPTEADPYPEDAPAVAAPFGEAAAVQAGPGAASA